MNLSSQSILLIGYGNMGGSLHSAWLNNNIDNIHVVDKRLTDSSSLQDVKFCPDIVFLAVKPQSMEELLPAVANKFGSSPLYVSIAAGKTISYFEKYLGAQAKIIRAMPNTPAQIGKGITAIIASNKVNEAQKQYAEKLFQAVGKIIWLEDENMMNAVTAISGSGPAYIFLLLESIIESGVKQGLPADIAKKLAIATVIGSGELALVSPESLAELRRNVTSKGGTTEAALGVLMQNDALKYLFADAIDAAVKRATELSSYS